MVARVCLSSPCCVYLHDKPVWDGKGAPLSNPTPLSSQHTQTPPGSTSLQGVLGSLSGWRNPIARAVADIGSWAGSRNPGKVRQGYGCPHCPNTHLVHSLRKGDGTWMRLGQGRAEFSRTGFTRGHARAVTHICTRRKGCVKMHSP